MTADIKYDEHDIALDQLAYLKDTSGVCARGSSTGWTWLRYHCDEWRAVRYATESEHLRDYLHGQVLTAEQAGNWLADNPATIEPVADAKRWSQSSNTIWETAERQGVFRDATRCSWCGECDENRTINVFESTGDGTVSLCKSCEESWDRAGELKRRAER